MIQQRSNKTRCRRTQEMGPVRDRVATCVVVDRILDLANLQANAASVVAEGEKDELH